MHLRRTIIRAFWSKGSHLNDYNLQMTSNWNNQGISYVCNEHMFYWKYLLYSLPTLFDKNGGSCECHLFPMIVGSNICSSRMDDNICFYDGLIFGWIGSQYYKTEARGSNFTENDKIHRDLEKLGLF